MKHEPLWSLWSDLAGGTRSLKELGRELPARSSNFPDARFKACAMLLK